MSRETFFKLFDSIVQHTLLYATEVLGLLHDDCPVEKVHLYACKKFLNVPARTPNDMVYGELGRYPLVVNLCVRTIKFWFRISKMEISRIPKQAYQLLQNLDAQRKISWVSKVRITLENTGFNFVWGR